MVGALTRAKSRKVIMAANQRHWMTHALQQFHERYNLADYEPDALIDLVERIEGKYRLAFMSRYWDHRPLVIVVARLKRRNLTASPKVRLVYNRRKQVIVTVLPLRPDPSCLRGLQTLGV